MTRSNLPEPEELVESVNQLEQRVTNLEAKTTFTWIDAYKSLSDDTIFAIWVILVLPTVGFTLITLGTFLSIFHQRMSRF